MNILKQISAVLAFALSTGAATTDAKELKFAHYLPTVHTLHQKVFVPFAEDVNKATNGEVTIKIYPAGELGAGPLQQYRRVMEGVADIVWGVVTYTPKIFPKTMIASKPGIGTTGVDITRRIWDQYDSHFADEFGRGRLLALTSLWPNVLMMRSNAVRSLADIQGRKIRTSSALDAPQVRAWGGVPSLIPVTETYQALTTGVIDGVYIAPSGLYAPWNFAEPAQYVTVGMDGSSTLFYMLMNKKTWDGLSKSQQAAIDRLTGREFSLKTAAVWGANDEKALARAKAGEQVTLIELKADTAAAFNKATARAVEAELAEAEKAGLPARAIYRDLRK